MNITLISCFRNSESYLSRYMNQVADLVSGLSLRNDHIDLIWGEGDSTDRTLELLQAYVRFGYPARIVDCTHGGTKDYQGVINEQRFKELGYVGRCMWAHIPADADVVIFVESDIIWQPETILHLIDRLQDYLAVSPMIYLRRQGWASHAFYDTWAGRKNGRHLEHYPPYCEGFDPDEPFQVDSMGSCMAFRGDLARGLKWDENVFVGISRQIYEHGGSLWIDPGLAIYHE